ncbi:phosphate starvation-inducible protein-like protein [Staphylococcus phage Twort]|uniref:ORF046 n=2 Tax=Staphylococcus phage Twort (strain DSM 17442 / HER 48) TaxID=2908167 RepID=Q4Z8Z9_BPTWO|nr:ORF046 [Staphylococcus phage Twort]AAX92341.1 ORF046 [Staphylococcus phage Twort]QIW89065.1 phosphate starvation-inducible protein-like protein [Staphylococcus phage Twort]
MTKTAKELEYKLRDYPNVKYNMVQHSVFHDFLSKASDEQLDFAEDFFDDEVEIIWSDSRAGTGKSFLSIALAYAEYLNKGKTMYYIISPVSDDIGALPGSKFSKESVYFGALYDALLELGVIPERAIYEMAEETLENFNEKSFDDCWIHAVSHIHLRGVNISSTMILDETQNFKRNDIKKTLTRFKKGNKALCIGSSVQIDLKNESKSGFVPYLEYFRGYEKSREHTLTRNFRSELSNYADNFKW